LPTSSPPLVFESDFDDREDDYGKQEEEREKKRLKALARGGRLSPSLEDEDEEDEEEFEAEVAQNGVDDEEMPAKRMTKSGSKSKSKKSAADPKSKPKGKQREVTETSGSAAGPSKSAKGKRKTATASGTSKTVTSTPHPADSAGSDSDNGDYAKKPGQISEETRERLFELESQFKGDVAKLARENGKSAKTFFQILGVQQKSTRATSAWNVFQSWYSQVKGNPGHRKSCTSPWFFQYLTHCFSARGCVLRSREGGFLGGVWTPREMGERHPRHRQHSMARQVAEGRRSTSSHQFPQRK
jgi:hypothetical protein